MTVFSTNLFGPSVRGAGRWLFARIERLPRPGYFLWAYPGYLNRYWRYMLALSSTSASVTWVRPREATRSSIRLRIKRRIRKGLRLMRRSASGSQVICCPSGNVDLFRRVEGARAHILPQQMVRKAVIESALLAARGKPRRSVANFRVVGGGSPRAASL